MACVTTRAFASVKSSAMTPRQPSVPNRIEGVARSDEDVAVRRVPVQQQPVYRSPGTDIAPAHFRRNHKHARWTFCPCCWLQDCVVHGDMFELPVNLA